MIDTLFVPRRMIEEDPDGVAMVEQAGYTVQAIDPPAPIDLNAFRARIAADPELQETIRSFSNIMEPWPHD